MSRLRKPVEPISQNEAAESTKNGSDSHTCQNSQTKRRPPTLPFCDSVLSSFRNWSDRRKYQELFDSAKRIRYRRLLANPDGQINGTRAEKLLGSIQVLCRDFIHSLQYSLPDSQFLINLIPSLYSGDWFYPSFHAPYQLLHYFNIYQRLSLFQCLPNNPPDSIITASHRIYVRTNLMDQLFQFVPEMFSGVQIRTVRRPIGKHYPIIFKPFHHLFVLMNKCVVMHKNQVWLPNSKQIVLQNFQI